MNTRALTTISLAMLIAIVFIAWPVLAQEAPKPVTGKPSTAPPASQPAKGSVIPPARAGEVVVARLIYGGKKGECFAPGFLAAVGNETMIKVRPTFGSVGLASDDLFNYPFIIMTGDGVFTLNAKEQANLKDYLTRGGFLLASAGCSDELWAQSFRAEFAKVMPAGQFVELKLTHAVFHTGPYDIGAVVAKHTAKSTAIYGMEIDGKLRVVFSPLGLNDTANAGAGCCCCGGNEIRNARDINANILVYALTH